MMLFSVMLWVSETFEESPKLATYFICFANFVWNSILVFFYGSPELLTYFICFSEDVKWYLGLGITKESVLYNHPTFQIWPDKLPLWFHHCCKFRQTYTLLLKLSHLFNFLVGVLERTFSNHQMFGDKSIYVACTSSYK